MMNSESLAYEKGINQLTRNSAVGDYTPAKKMLGLPDARQPITRQNPERPSAAMLR